WGMPDAVRRGMRAVGAPGEDPVELATAFGNELATAIYREDNDASRAAANRVLSNFGKRLDVSREALAAIADAAVAETRDTFSSAGVALDDLRLTRQIARALSEPATGATAASKDAAESTDADASAS